MSMDDRKVKRAFRSLSRVEGNRDNIPAEEAKPAFLEITPHPIVASEKELEANPRSASAKLRILQRKE